VGIFFFARNSLIESSVSWRDILVQHPIACNVLSDSLDPFLKTFRDIFVEGVINRLYGY
jgi:hypothetical protein